MNNCHCQQKCQARPKAPTLLATHKQTSVADKKPFELRFLSPCYWGIWLVMVMVLPLIYLPLRVQFMIGKGLGLLVFKLARRRRDDTLINLALALPEQTADEHYAIARQVFINQGIGIFESLCAWFRPEVFFKSFSISGLQHLVQAQNNDSAILLLGAHYTILDLGGRICTQFFTADCVYRPQNNPLLEWLVYNARRHIFDEQITHKDMRKLIARIRAGKVVWYTPDQDFGLEHGVMAPFFGVPAATITAPRRLARLGNKDKPPVVMTLRMQRTTPDMIARNQRPHYHVAISPVIDNYPSDDEVMDATRINALLEANIRHDISQWMWFHRRFKTQADGKQYYQKKK